ncbi:GNAT family N-acetyltransferase [Shouchella hunanensis]|uniref:GNAT family N-acetyltransferase n=1 Tax=Shouchella hunanensis TaxID=766894 RepID=A0ABY7W0I2_9BACI|nr:GNAT family N-acetyltransferase [Shouchella hunanensis]WDF02447.1 GNAT family N-acetyltransferase [Shouchella hunanensis]
MIRELQVRNNDQSKALYGLQKVAYQIEENMLDFHEIPPLMESFAQFLKTTEMFYLYIEEGSILGAVSIDDDSNQAIEVTRMMVDPRHFRKGIATKLLQHIETLLNEPCMLKVATGAKNIPAIQLYQSQGYQLVERKVVKGGVELVYFEKNIN